jgi:hypothetical protein
MSHQPAAWSAATFNSFRKGNSMLKINVGFNRKVGEANYGSRGASVNLELDLDSGLIDEPERLKDRIRQLFGLAKASVDEELHSQPATNGHAHGSQVNGNGHANPCIR